MDEDRTQAPSARRRLQAREHGQVAHSPKLTAAAGLLGAVLVIFWRGDALAEALLGLLRNPLPEGSPLSPDVGLVVAHLRGLVLAVAWPLGMTLASFVTCAFAVHQAQVRGLWAPGLLAPDPTRLWAVGQVGAVSQRAGRGFWGLVESVVVVAVSVWVLRGEWHRLQLLANLPVAQLAQASAESFRHLLLVVAAIMLVLGAVDFALQYQRFEAMLRLTPEQQREDFRSMEGDPALRARRRRIAQGWREGADDLLKGASLIVAGTRGLSVVLVGGPPPRHITVHAIQSGAAGEALRVEAERQRIPIVLAPDLARRFAQRKPPSLPPTPELRDELAQIWPVSVPAANSSPSSPTVAP